MDFYRYKKETISKEEIMTIVEDATRAPYGYYQDYKITVVQDEATKKKLAEAIYSQSWIATAPVVFVFSGLKDSDLGETDAVFAAAYAQLSAHALGWSIDSFIFITCYRF